MLQATTSLASPSKDWIYLVCLGAMILSLLLQNLPGIRERRLTTMRSGPLFLLALMALLTAFIYDSDDTVNIPCTVVAVSLIILNDWLTLFPLKLKHKP